MPGTCNAVLATVVQHSDLFSIDILYINSDESKMATTKKGMFLFVALLDCLRKYRVYLHRLLTAGKGCLHVASSVFFASVHWVTFSPAGA